jgi:putative salt-induced outer membrane protein YdiY
VIVRLAQVLAWLLLAATALNAQAQAADELLDLERQLAAALGARDMAVYDRLLAPGFVLRGVPDVPRSTWIENAVRLCWGGRADITDFSRRDVSPDTAIVTLVLTTYQDPQTCDPAIVRSLLTDVWRRGADGWQLVLRHSGPAGGGVERQFAAAPPPPPRWLRSAEVSLVSTGGNSDTETLGLGGAVTWRPAPWLTEARVSFVRSETAGVETARALTANLRQSRAITPRLDAFGRAESLTNEFAGIEHRLTLDAGVGYRPVNTAVHTLRFDGGLGYTRESRLAGDDLSFAIATGGAAYGWQPARRSRLTDTAIVTASLADLEDWRFSNTFAFTTNLTRLLSVRLSQELKYTNAPVPGFRRTDRQLSLALVATF